MQVCGRCHLKGDIRRPTFHPWVGKICWRRKGQPTPGFLPGELHGQRSLAGCSPRGRTESDKQMCPRSTHLCHGLPRRGVVLAGMDPVIPPSLHHVDDGLNGHVELRGPLDLQLPRLQFREPQLLPGLQGDTWNRTTPVTTACVRRGPR